MLKILTKRALLGAIILLTSICLLFPFLKVFATEQPIIIYDFYADSADSYKIKIKWGYNPNYTVASSTEVSFEIYNNYGWFRDSANNLWKGYATCKSSVSNTICFSSPTDLKDIYNTILAHNSAGLTYDNVADYLAGDCISSVVGTLTWVPPGTTEQEWGITPFCWGDTPIPATELPVITVDNPATGSTITSTATMLGLSYENFDTEIYAGFLIGFLDHINGVSSDTYQYDIDTSDGSIDIPLSFLMPDRNGRWDLHILAYGGNAWELGPGGRGNIDIYSDELAPDYYLNFDVDWLPNQIPFTDFSTWYASNTEYSTPTAFASGIANLLVPIFEKVADFGNRVGDYFNTNEAYDRGFGLASIFPIFQAYVDKISFFFGYFPLFSYFKYIIIILLGIFVIRTILKFIPFIG